MRRRIARALLSTWDKTGLDVLARALAAHGVELISTGGTRAELQRQGWAVTDVGCLTGRAEAFGGRMKSLSFEVASALLFVRERDADEARALGIEPIDLVVCNLYPFEQKVAEGRALEELVELIDIGGPTMIRAAAKNHAAVAVLVDPADYAPIAEELTANQGSLSAATRLRLARKAFARTAAYDAAIAAHLHTEVGEPGVFEVRTQSAPLRYGENPHQAAHVLEAPGALCFDVLGGKPLSYNNYLDLQAALDAVVDLDGAAAAVIKHGNPCGLASAPSPARALAAAWAGDPLSAFGSVIACNAPLDLETARFFALDAADKTARKFVEVVAAPDFSAEALDYLRQHKNLRILRVHPASGRGEHELRWVRGLILRQQRDAGLPHEVRPVSRATHSPDAALLRFGEVAVRQLKSNAIALVERQGETLSLLGMGCGQPNRVDSVQLAVARARARLQREGRTPELGHTVLFSDAFFPFADGVQLALDAGVRCVVQPGGSLRDAEVIAACDAAGATLVHTGVRHFLH